jgi:hypothetical protein
VYKTLVPLSPVLVYLDDFGVHGAESVDPLVSSVIADFFIFVVVVIGLFLCCQGIKKIMGENEEKNRNF